MMRGLIKALGKIRSQQLTILDASAGLLRDSRVLQNEGHRVIACEREQEPYLELLRGLKVHKDSFISLYHADAREIYPLCKNIIDCVYYDPMFVKKSKSALPKKEMAHLRNIVQDQDQEEVLSFFLEQNVKVVFKRSLKDDILFPKKRTYCVSEKTCRFDCYERR